MNPQVNSLLAHRLKKLVALTADGVDVADNVRALLESDRNLRAERMSGVVQEPMRLLNTNGLADSAGL
jgi:hypothetical protein